MKDKLFSLGSIGAAFVASLCCIGPVALGGLGMGAALASTFAPLRPYFLTATGIFLAWGFYSIYRKPKSEVACEGEVCEPAGRPKRAAKTMLWLATVVVLILALFPYYGGDLISAAAARNFAAASARLEKVELEINGISCPSCAGTVEYMFLETPGVAEAEINPGSGRAVVSYDPTQTEPAKIVEALRGTIYSAKVLELVTDQ